MIARVTSVIVFPLVVMTIKGCASEIHTPDEVAEEIIHDVMFPNDYAIPGYGGDFCFYSKLPEDQQYHVTGFGWSESKLSNWVMAMMFTISDEAVRQFQEYGWDLSQPMPCDSRGQGFPDTMPEMAMAAGGYMLFQQGGEEFDLPQDQGMLVGKGTARRHALIRWMYRPGPEGPNGPSQTDNDAGYHIHLTTKLRPTSIGEAKFALKGVGANNTLNIPPGEPAWVHYVQSTLQASNQVWRGDGVELLKVKLIGRLGYRFRILEAKGGGTFSRPDWESFNSCALPHHQNLLLEEGDFQEIFRLDFNETGRWYDVNKKVLLKNGNSYRAEYTYDTTGQACYTTNGNTPPCETNFDAHFFYKEIPGNNEPFPGYVMDVGPYFMRTTNIDNETANDMLAKWREDPAHGPESDPYGCPQSLKGE